jgi:hypothetical protein
MGLIFRLTIFYQAIGLRQTAVAVIYFPQSHRLYFTKITPASTTVPLTTRPELSFLTLMLCPLAPSAMAVPLICTEKPNCPVLMTTLSWRLISGGSITLFAPKITPGSMLRAASLFSTASTALK